MDDKRNGIKSKQTLIINITNSDKRMSVVSPTSRFAYKSIRLHRGRFAYMTKSFRLHGPSRFAYIEVVSPTQISRNIFGRWISITACS